MIGLRKRSGLRALGRLSVAAALFLLAACSRDMSDLEGFIDEVNARPARPLEPIPEIEPYEPVDYAAADLRDPFVPNEIFNPGETEQSADNSSGPRPIAGREKEPLEAFPLDSLKMVGTIKIAGVRYALVRSSEPLIYRVKQGDYLGQNHGEVMMVDPTRLALKELFADGAGRWVERETSMALANAPGVTK